MMRFPCFSFRFRDEGLGCLRLRVITGHILKVEITRSRSDPELFETQRPNVIAESFTFLTENGSF